MQAVAKGEQKVVMLARVYRAYPKPWYMPHFVFMWFCRRFSPFTGYFEEQRVVASTQMRNIQFLVPPAVAGGNMV